MVAGMTGILSSMAEILSAMAATILNISEDRPEDEMDGLERSSLQHRALIDMLPSELLGHIFEFVLPYTADFVPTWPMFTRLHQQLVDIMYVCRHWRDVARGSPSLWSVVDVCKVTDGPGGTPPSLGDVGEEFLRRSGSVPLTVFYISRMEETIFTSAFHDLERIIRSHGDRVAHLHACIPDSRMLSPMLSWPEPSLRSLTLCMVYEGGDEGETSSDPLFAGEAPLLRKLAVSNHLPSRIQRSVADLTHITLQHIPQISLGDGLLDMLERNHRLEYLLIAEPVVRPETPWLTPTAESTRSISLPSLRQLYFNGIPMGDSWLLHILSSLRVPESCDFRAKPRRDEQLVEQQGLSHLSFLPPPAQFHPLLRIDCVQVTITTSQARRGFAIHSGSLFITADGNATGVDWPSWVTASGARGRLVLIVASDLSKRPALLPEILLLYPELRILEIVDRGHNTPTISDVLETYKSMYGATRPWPCPDMRRIDWHTTTNSFDAIRATTEHRMRGGTPLQEVLIHLEVEGSRRTVRRITVGDGDGSVVEDVPREDAKRLSGATIVGMYSEAVTPRLPDGRADLEVDPLWA
ncbi:hypothetical protein BD626DRAFT_513896 [Schizophyllum amplum]|uniref:F-box domain-containing protein n=1 Tax=Schizophyllum amplum TaxID=97359 RepID=A0A550BZ29_9AGAR|nr:hypothetical protein BD626DRAFT_513896 [Auriculariopsis ampla]